MKLSIRFWTILALNACVLAIVVAAALMAQEIAGRIVEERLTNQTVANVSRFLGNRALPLSDTMMGYLRELLRGEWVVVDADGAVLASSLPAENVRAFQSGVGEAAGGGIALGGVEYRCAWQPVQPGQLRSGGAAARLFVLIPAAEFRAARVETSRRIAAMMLPAAGAATLLAILLGLGITRPLRRLTAAVQRINPDRTSETPPPADGQPHEFGRGLAELRGQLRAAGPSEIRTLAAALVDLLERLAAARRKLAESERLATLGRVSMSVAHELRNPLSGIKMNMRVLHDEAAIRDEPVFEAILREIDRMELYLNELMSLSSGARRSTARAAPQSVRLSALFESVLAILSGRCRHARVEVRRSFPPDERPVEVEQAEIRQVMMNLVVNAVEAMPTGGVLTVSTELRGSSVAACVSDTGAGVTAQAYDVFEAFASSKPHGAGLGLYISRQIVERHGGQIGFRNLGPGAEFWFELPGSAATSPAGVHAGPERLVD